MTEESDCDSDLSDIVAQFYDSVHIDPASLVAVWSKNSSFALSESKIGNSRELLAVDCMTPARKFVRSNATTEDTDNTEQSASAAPNVQYDTPSRSSGVTLRRRRLNLISDVNSVREKGTMLFASQREDGEEINRELPSCLSSEQIASVPAKIKEKRKIVAKKQSNVKMTSSNTSSTREESTLKRAPVPRPSNSNSSLSRSHIDRLSSLTSRYSINSRKHFSTKTVQQSPLCRTTTPRVAFGSTIPKEVRLPYQQRIEGVKAFTQTTPNKSVELRSYPGPSGTTPLLRKLTVPTTPEMLKRQKKPAKTPNVFERLSQPGYKTPISKKKSICPNTVSNGIRVPSVIRKRGGF